MIILRKGVTLSTLEQKEFGIVSDIRSKIAKRISKSIGSELAKREKAIDTNLNKIKFDKKARTKLYRIANQRGSRISRLNLKSNPLEKQSPMVISNQDALNLANADDILLYKNSKKRVNRLRKSAENKKKTSQIIIPPGLNNIEKIAHEMGHISNSISKNPISRLIHSRAEKASVNSSRRFNMLNSKMGTNRRSGLKNILEDIINEESIIAEEKRSSKKGLKILKEIGANEKELEKAKENYKIALNTYKGKGRANWKSTLRNTIQNNDKKLDSFRND